MSKTYHMIGYIHEGPDSLRRTLDANEAALEYVAGQVRAAGIQRIVLTGVGSSYTAPMMAMPAFRYHCPVPTFITSGPELGYYALRWVNEQTMVIAVSRSGERGVVVDTLGDASNRGAFTVAVTGVGQSLLAKKADLALVTAEGPEKTWPKTKSVVTATGLLMRLALALAKPEDEEAAQRLHWLLHAPQAMSATIEQLEPALQALLPSIEAHELLAIVGTGANYGTAIEGAMKVMEASSIATRFDTTDGLLNGPVGGFDARWLVAALVTAVDRQQTVELLRVARGLGARSLCVCPPQLELNGLADYVLTLPQPPDALLGALLYLVPLQLLAYYWTVARGMNPDEPACQQAILDAVLPPGRQEPA
jgi:glucosamine--fructose-6-phosphate aminotransferase (isomerizing)